MSRKLLHFRGTTFVKTAVYTTQCSYVMIFKPKQGIKLRKCRICTVENLYFEKQALPIQFVAMITEFFCALLEINPTNLEVRCLIQVTGNDSLIFKNLEINKFCAKLRVHKRFRILFVLLQYIYILLDVLLCSIAEYFYKLCHILVSP